MSQNAYRQMVARYNGTCHSCNLPVIAGNEILYRPTDRRVHHNACPIVVNRVINTAPAMTQAQALSNLKVNPVTSKPSNGEGRAMANEMHDLLATYSSELPATGNRVNTPTVEEQPTATGISDGFYTVVLEDGTHRTFRIRTQGADETFAPGKQIIATLTGSDNESSYTQWGFINGATVNVWKSRTDKVGDWPKFAAALISGDHSAAGLAYAVESGNCYRCNRRLTTPESVALGLGKVCAGKE